MWTYPPKDGSTDVYAIGSVALGKKSYTDILEYVNGEGDKIHDQLVRMKGFPTLCIEYYDKVIKLSVFDVC